MLTENIVYKKEVNWSMFNDGISIPIQYQVVFKQIAGRYLQRGESKPIKLYLNGKSFDADLRNLGISDDSGGISDKVQIRYYRNSDIALALRQCFYRSWTYIEHAKSMQPRGSKKPIPLPDNLKEYLAIYTTEYDDTYILEPIFAEDLQEYRNIIMNQQEQQIEMDFDYSIADPNAGFALIERVTKIRKLNRIIGQNLKLLYGYRCQLCGKLIGEEYGAHVAEAHHIDYYVNSLNNDSNNQMVVCPNHHSIIHETNPKFDRKRMIYLYPNGMEQKVLLNLHLK